MLRIVYLVWTCFVLARSAEGSDQYKSAVDLSYQNLTTFDVNSTVLRSFSSDILWLSLQGNDLTAFPCDISYDLPSVEKLILSDNHRIQFPSDGSPFLIAPSLTDLNCERCRIKTIFTQSLRYLLQLEILRLGSNGIEWIETSAFRRNRHIQKMDLSRNKLTTLPIKMLKGLFQIEELDLSYNRKLAPLKDHPFLASDSLRILKCNYCGFTATQEATFSELTNLKELHLVGNKLLTVPFLPSPMVVVVRGGLGESPNGRTVEWRDQSNLIKQRQYGWRFMIKLYV